MKNDTFGDLMEGPLERLTGDILRRMVERPNMVPDYSKESLHYTTMIFMDVISDYFYKKTNLEGIDIEEACELSKCIGQELRQFIIKYTNIDTHQLVKEIEGEE